MNGRFDVLSPCKITEHGNFYPTPLFSAINQVTVRSGIPRSACIKRTLKSSQICVVTSSLSNQFEKFQNPMFGRTQLCLPYNLPVEACRRIILVMISMPYNYLICYLKNTITIDVNKMIQTMWCIFFNSKINTEDYSRYRRRSLSSDLRLRLVNELDAERWLQTIFRRTINPRQCFDISTCISASSSLLVLCIVYR